MTLSLLLSLTLASPALPARDTAHVHAQGESSVGVFSPYRRGIGGGKEYQTHPLFFLVAPNALLRMEHKTSGSWKLSGEYGLSIPTYGARLLTGEGVAKFYSRANTVAWALVPRFGLALSKGDLNEGLITTLRADIAVGVPLGEHDMKPIEVGVLDLVFAPLQSGYRARVGGIYDRRMSAKLRARASADLFSHGEQPSSWSARAGVGFDLVLSGKKRLALGVIWLNSDTRAVNAEREPIRSNDFLPTFDLIF